MDHDYVRVGVTDLIRASCAWPGNDLNLGSNGSTHLVISPKGPAPADRWQWRISITNLTPAMRAFGVDCLPGVAWVIWQLTFQPLVIRYQSRVKNRVGVLARFPHVAFLSFSLC